MIIKVRKIFLFFLLTLLLSLETAFIPRTANADQTQDCNLSHVNDDQNGGPLVSIQYAPAVEKLAGNGSFTATINGVQRLTSGGYNLIVYGNIDLGPPPGRSYYNTENVNQGDTSINFTVNTYDNGFGLPVFEGNDWFNVELDRASDNAPICTDLITIPPGPGDPGGPPPADTCTLTLGGQPWRPQGTKVTIKADALDTTAHPDDQKIGFVVRNLRTNQDIKNTCITAKELRDGLILDSTNGWSFFEGTYSVSVGNNFEFFGNCTMDSKPNSKICNSADDNYKINVSADGGWQYFNCTTEAANRADGDFLNWDQSQILQWCNLKTLPGPRARHGLAPYCVTDPYNTDPTIPKGVCSNNPGIGMSCTGQKCDTAIGSFSYDPPGFAKSVVALFLSLAGGIVLLFLIINGYKLMTSAGDPEKVKEARDSIISAIAGLLLIIFALIILQFLTVDVLQLPGFKP